MEIIYQKNVKNDQLQRRKKLAKVFLLYNFFKFSKAEKEKFFNKQVPEVILRTMKLEGEEITTNDIKKILKSK